VWEEHSQTGLHNWNQLCKASLWLCLVNESENNFNSSSEERPVWLWSSRTLRFFFTIHYGLFVPNIGCHCQIW